MISKPKLVQRFGDYYLLWFLNSNTYSCIDSAFFFLVDSFLKSKDLESFHEELGQRGFPTPIARNELIETYDRIKEFFVRSNLENPINDECSEINISKLQTLITKRYISNSIIFEVNYSSRYIKDLIHPIVAHLEYPSNKDEINNSIIIASDNERLIISHNDIVLGTFPKEEYHKLQGKFLMTIINITHQQSESDWIGLLHASAISKNDQAILCVGNSGNGKSTLVSLLSANGFNLIADDTVPLNSTNLNLYYNPAAVSVKPKSLKVVQDFWPLKEDYSQSYLNPSKGKITYIPMHSSSMNLSYPCRTVVRVNYQEGSKTDLRSLDFRKALEFIIQESWISSNPKNAERFFDWLGDLQFYELTYSNYKEVIPLFENLLNN